jgi:hypothetical protein
MNATELESLRAWAQAMLPTGHVQARQVLALLGVIERFRCAANGQRVPPKGGIGTAPPKSKASGERDGTPITHKNIQAHPSFQKEEFFSVSENRYEVCFTIGDFEIIWQDVDYFEFWHEGSELYPQPKTWGDLQAIARMLGASLDAPAEKQTP